VIGWIEGIWSDCIGGVATHVVAPLLSSLRLSDLSSDPHEIAESLVISSLQVLIIALVFRPLESLVPAERWPDRRHAKIDRFYTLLKLLGVMPIFTYLIMEPAGSWLSRHVGGGAVAGDSSFGLPAAVPWFRGHAMAFFLVEFAIFDLVYYLIHRLQHAVPWWWALHSLHHSQRQLNCWSNDRDHYLDDLFEYLIVGGVSLAIGIAPADYALLVLFGALIENFSHANVRIGFGPVFEKVFVDPRYHRLHHMVIDRDRPHMHNCNFALVLPVWDIVFGTALYGEKPHPCGVDDPAVDADNELGFLGQQLAGLKRFWSALPRPGYRLAVP
jgi:sterol desaturase/sphingolipid hydroxylase (fatty acid hydroxylase superfamily)